VTRFDVSDVVLLWVVGVLAGCCHKYKLKAAAKTAVEQPAVEEAEAEEEAAAPTEEEETAAPTQEEATCIEMCTNIGKQIREAKQCDVHR